MFKHILIPTDGSALSNKAIQRGIALAKALGAAVTTLHVMEPLRVGNRPVVLDGLEAEYQHLVELRARDAFAVAVKSGQETGVPVSTVQVPHAHPYEAVIETAQEKGCDLIFMASHGRSGIEGLVLGSETNKVLTHTKIPVIVYR